MDGVIIETCAISGLYPGLRIGRNEGDSSGYRSDENPVKHPYTSLFIHPLHPYKSILIHPNPSLFIPIHPCISSIHHHTSN